MNKHNAFKKINIWMIIAGLGLTSLSGCAVSSAPEVEEQVDLGEEIELIDPVGVANAYETAEYRNIYIAEVIQSVASPMITEYQYTTSEPFWKYGALPGDEVTKGDVLIYGKTESVEESIEALTDKMRTSAEDHTEEITSLYENRYDAYKSEYKASCAYMDVKNGEPKEDDPWYSAWAAGIMPLESAYKNAKLNRERIETSITESEDLYALELTYNSECLAKLESKRDQAQVVANADGTLVATNYYSAGDSIVKNSEVMAVGELTTKIVYAPYLSPKALSKLADIYVLADGVRYEVTYEPIEQTEYSRLKQKNTDVYMPFVIEDGEDKISMGQDVALVIVKEKAEDVLCVPSDSIVRENGQSYVYLYEESGSTSTPVETGLVGNMYTEILSGLKVGDKVLSESAVTSVGKSINLAKGGTSQEYSGNGMLIYPSTEWLSNPAKFGNTYISEILVEKNEAVVAGQELIRLEVTPDSTAIQRLERKISRQQARLQTLLNKKSQNYSDEVDNSLEQAIRQKNIAISRYQEELSKLQEYSGIVTLTADYDAIILGLTELKVGDHVNYKDNIICLADTTESMLAVDNAGGKLGFGKEVTVSFKGNDGMPVEVTGKVVNVIDAALSKTLQTATALIRFEGDAASTVAETGGSAISSGGGWGRSMFKVTASVSEFDNCVLVPRSAVVIKSGDTFVKVRQDDGRIQLVQFLSGGYDMQNYWVVSGLSEGMEICLD